MTDHKKNARGETRAKDSHSGESKPGEAETQALRAPRPDQIKAAIDPAAFYACELEGSPPLRAGGDGWTQNIRCPFHPDANGSFGVNIESGAFKCFGCEAKGGSVLDFAMLRDGLTLDQARAELARRYGVQPGESPRNPPQRPRKAPPAAPALTHAPLAPIPPAALATRPQAHPRHGSPSATWEYRDPSGRPLCYVLRFDPPGERKQFSPLTWTPAGAWEWKAPASPRPLYGLDRLAARPEAPALIAEGEKSADASAGLLPDYVTLTTMNGAQAPAKSDFSPLSGRRVMIWPDADPPGAVYAAKVAELARAAGAVSIDVLDLSALARDPKTGEPRELPRGWDCGDAAGDGWTPETLAAAVRWVPAGTEAQAKKPAAATAGGEALPHPFELTATGIHYRRPSGAKGGGDDGPPLFVCPPLRVLSVTRDSSGGEFGRLVEFHDLDGEPRREVIGDRERQGSGDTLRARLAALGFEIGTSPQARNLFLDLLRRWTPEARARSVTRTGWADGGGAFVLPDKVLGEGPEPVILAAEGERPAFRTRGTLAAWRDTIGRLCVGNSRLTFAVSLAFAPPLLHLTNTESGGFHLRGTSTDASSSGKTTAQRVACSVAGSPDYLQRWRTTDNALEALAELHSDSLLILDELNQMDPKAAGEAAYMLANGTGKARMDRSAGARPIKRWRLLFLSSGEIGLAEHMATVQRRSRAGQEVRMVEIPADARAGFGVFEDLHGYSDGAAFAVALTDAAAMNYGTPFVAFIEELIAHRATLPAVIKRMRDDFVLYVLQGIGKPSGQVRRVAARFGLVAVAGELATDAGITGWKPGAARDAAERCFGDWLKSRGGPVSAEERELLIQVRLWFELHGNRFRWKDRALDDHAPEVARQCGFKDDPSDEAGGTVYYCFRETFKAEVLMGYDPTDAARVLMRRGLLLGDADGNPTRKERLPGHRNPTRVYVTTSDLLRAGV